MKPTKIAFEKRYSDDSISFPVDELDWLIESLMNIRGLITDTAAPATREEVK